MRSGPTSRPLPRIDRCDRRADRARERPGKGPLSACGSQASADEEDAMPWTAPAIGTNRVQSFSRSRCRARYPRRSRPAALRREGGPAVAAAQPDQAPRRLPEPRVLQEAEHAPLDGDDAAGHLVRRGPPAARRPSARLPGRRSRSCSASTASRSTIEDERQAGAPSRFHFQGRAHAGPAAGGRARCSRTTSASSSRRRASARRSSARTSSPRERAAR